MMLETVAADVLQQLLKVWHFDHAVATKRLKLVFGEASLTDIASDVPVQIVGRDAAVGERSRGNAPDDGSKGIFFANRPAMISW